MDSIVSTLGAGSGIDTRTLIDQLVAAERTARTTPLTTRATALDARISALGQLRSALQGIASSLDTRVRSGALGLSPSSGDSAAISIARQGVGPAAPFITNVTVNRLASAQVLTGPALTAGDAPVGLGTLTLSFGTRTDLGGGNFSFSGSGARPPVDIAITAANNSLTGLRDAINAANAGVTASIVANAGSATLSLRGSDGAAQAFILSAAEDAASPGLARFAYTPGNRAMTLATAAGDADLSVDGIAVRRATNTIDDLVAGTRITLKKADPAATVQLSAARDGAELASTLSDLATTLGAMRGLIADFRKSATATEPGGALVTDATARAMDQRIARLATTSFEEANGLALRDIGISIARDGSVSFDESRFARLSPNRYADAEALLRALAAPALSTRPNRLQSIADLAAPATAGLSRQRAAVTRDLTTVDTRLATFRANLVRQYAAMDRLVAASKAVEEQLDQQIAAWNNQRNN